MARLWINLKLQCEKAYVPVDKEVAARNLQYDTRAKPAEALAVSRRRVPLIHCPSCSPPTLLLIHLQAAAVPESLLAMHCITVYVLTSQRFRLQPSFPSTPLRHSST